MSRHHLESRRNTGVPGRVRRHPAARTAGGAAAVAHTPAGTYNQGEGEMTDSDLDLLAYDIADTIDRGEYPLDVSQDDIRAALPAFIEQIRQNAAASDD